MHGYFRFRYRHIEWQTGPWSCPWHHKSFDPIYEVWCHFAGFGPFQFHWYGEEKF